MILLAKSRACIDGFAAILLLTCCNTYAGEVYEVTSPYHHVRVVDDGDMRTLCFDDATESRISLKDPMKGHFEYTEYFHMPWLWNTNMSQVLMIGLGAGTAQRSYQHYYPQISVTTVEIDPVVLRVAKDYFSFKESDRQRVFVEDGRLFLRRNTGKHDAILLDAYVQGRYGSAIPQHLATKEFFELVRERLTTNGVLAYNVIGSLTGWRADIVGATYRTLKEVFPQVYMFPAKSSQNIVFIATKAAISADIEMLRQRATSLVQTKRVTLPGFRERLDVFRTAPPPNAQKSPVLTDDYAPVEGLAAGGG
jgi:spermidine synthase